VELGLYSLVNKGILTEEPGSEPENGKIVFGIVLGWKSRRVPLDPLSPARTPVVDANSMFVN